MDALDADGKVLKSTLGRPAERDIVQVGVVAHSAGQVFHGFVWQ
jgi:hypothetical protein